jgi:hypothetical protein
MTMLTRVRAYHSIRAHRHGGVYHDRTDCAKGQLLHSQHLAAGTSGLSLCSECRALDEQPETRAG